MANGKLRLAEYQADGESENELSNYLALVGSESAPPE